MMRRRLTILLATTTAALLLGTGVAGAGGGGHSVCDGFGDSQQFLMRDNCFEGIGHVVAAGEVITVNNVGSLPHTITAVDGSFDSGVIDPGETFELTLDDVGAVPIYCTLHGTATGSGMAGLLAVEAPGGAGAAVEAAGPATRTPLWGAAAVVAIALAVVGLRRRRLVRDLEERASSSNA